MTYRPLFLHHPIERVQRRPWPAASLFREAGKRSQLVLAALAAATSRDARGRQMPGAQMNQIVADRLDAIRRSLVAQAAAGRPMPSASKGQERETFLHGVLSRVFPAHFRFGTGSITDAAGAISGQVDLVVELPFFPSIPVPPAEVRLYFAEGVGAAIEVKSDLSSRWDQVMKTTAGIKVLKRQTAAGSMWIGPRPSETIPVFAVGCTGRPPTPPDHPRVTRVR